MKRFGWYFESTFRKMTSLYGKAGLLIGGILFVEICLFFTEPYINKGEGTNKDFFLFSISVFFIKASERVFINRNVLSTGYSSLQHRHSGEEDSTKKVLFSQENSAKKDLFEKEDSAKKVLFFTPFIQNEEFGIVGLQPEKLIKVSEKETVWTTMSLAQAGCEFSNCFGTHDRSLFPVEDFDAVIFHGRNMDNDLNVCTRYDFDWRSGTCRKYKGSSKDLGIRQWFTTPPELQN